MDANEQELYSDLICERNILGLQVERLERELEAANQELDAANRDADNLRDEVTRVELHVNQLEDVLLEIHSMCRKNL